MVEFQAVVWVYNAAIERQNQLTKKKLLHWLKSVEIPGDVTGRTLLNIENTY